LQAFFEVRGGLRQISLLRSTSFARPDDYQEKETSNDRRPQAPSGDSKGGHYGSRAGEDRLTEMDNLKTERRVEHSKTLQSH
jgi:hypothetical protein